MNVAHNVVDTILNNDFSLLNQPHTDELTNQVRDLFDNLSANDYAIARNNMEERLNRIYEENQPEFLLKENIIYYLGRGKDINYSLLKKIYYKEENLHLKLNLFFSLLSSFDEEVESDFISKISPGNELDNIIRSWTMAFFANIDNPYDYIDNGTDSPTKALKARLNRFEILLDKNHKKYKKSLSYLYIDLMVVWLFLNNRDSSILSEEDYKIISDIPENYSEFSVEKNNKINSIKKMILEMIN